MMLSDTCTSRGIVVVLLTACASLCQAEEGRRVSVAVADLKSSGSSAWLGASIAESLRVKLSAMDGVTVLDREETLAAARAARRSTLRPERFNTDFLVTGVAKVMGSGSSTRSRLMISASVVSAAGAAHRPLPISVRGVLGDLFKHEDALAARIAAAMGLPRDEAAFGIREARDLKAARSFGEGLLRLAKAEAMVGDSKKPSAMTCRRATTLLKEGVTLFQKAQSENGAFFGGAHLHEGLARALMARVAPDEGSAKRLRDETIAKYREDAEDGTLALYDLGRVLQANMQYEEAIAAYNEYISRIGAGDNTIVWDSGRHRATWITMPDLLHPDVPGTTNVGFYYPTKHHAFYQDRRDIVALDLKNGKQIWRLQLSKVADYPFIRFYCPKSS